MTSGLLQAVSTVVSSGNAAAFKAAVPTSMRIYADLILEAATAHGLSPWLLAGIMWAESNAGDALTPKGAGGTGDFIARDPKQWTSAGPNGLPPDGKGWGRGLMQIDYGVHHYWVIGSNWADARTNINKGAEILAANLKAFQSRVMLDQRYTNGETVATGALLQRKLGIQSGSVFPDPRPLQGEALYAAALAAYNAGQLQVLQAVAAGRDPQSVTYRKDYVTFISTRIAGWASAFGGA